MRELKFKAVRLNLDKTKIAEPFSLYEYVIGMESEETKVGEFLFPAGTLFLQFIGLKDKNGKEIYEGDIIRVYDSLEKESYLVAEVYYSERYSEFCLVGANSLGFYLLKGDYFEVIGNKFDNEELHGELK